jgi:hypothetical protein
VRPLLAAAASEGPSDTAGGSACGTPGAKDGLSYQRCMLRAIQLAVLLLFQVANSHADKHAMAMPQPALCCDQCP